MFFIDIIPASRTGNFFLVSCLCSKSFSYYWVASTLRQFWMILSPNKLWRKIFYVMPSFLLFLPGFRTPFSSCLRNCSILRVRLDFSYSSSLGWRLYISSLGPALKSLGPKYNIYIVVMCACQAESRLHSGVGLHLSAGPS